MRIIATVAAIILLTLTVPVAGAHPAGSLHASVRHKSSVKTIRGIVFHLHRGGFTLKTNANGNLNVILKPATQITERKHAGSFSLSEGDHVGVHGILTGTQFTAITIQIVPIKPKQFSIRGIVGSASSSRIMVTASGKTYVVTVTGSTGLQVANGPRSVLKNDHVLVRLEPQGSGYLAVRIRVYSRKVAGKHVQIQGTLLSMQGTNLIVETGSTHTAVRLTASTTLHTSGVSATRPKLVVGQRLTIHACCEGGPFTATSIHILVTRAIHPTQLIRGTVAATSPRAIVTRTTGGSVTIEVDGSTRVTLTGRIVGVGGIHSGDDVSVRAWRNGSLWQAKSVLIHAASRKPHTVSGQAMGTQRGGALIVERAGKQYTVVADKRTSITSGVTRLSLQAIKSGDHIKATGMLSGLRLAASTIQVTPVKPRAKSIRGTIQQVTSSEIVVIGDDGKQYRVRPARGVRVTLHGTAAPSAALSRGTRIHARGYLSGNALAASTVSVTVQTRTIQGRIARIAAGKLDVESRSSTYGVDLPKGVVIADGGHVIVIGTVRVGAYARVAGYVEASLSLKAIRVDIYHPHVTVIGDIVSAGTEPKVTTTAGKSFTLRFPSGLHITVSRLPVSLTSADLAVGMRVHAAGIVGTDGVVQVATASIRLTSLTVRGTLTKLESGALTVQAPEGTIRARLSSSTPISQTSRTLKWNDLVVGDDVSVYGYRLSSSAMLTRRVVVHRQRITLTGTVSSVTSDGFVMDAADGSHRVISTGVPVDSPNGQPPSVGATVHVRGYVRGDGVVLATTVTVKAA